MPCHTKNPKLYKCISSARIALPRGSHEDASVNAEFFLENCATSESESRFRRAISKPNCSKVRHGRRTTSELGLTIPSGTRNFVMNSTKNNN